MGRKNKGKGKLFTEHVMLYLIGQELTYPHPHVQAFIKGRVMGFEPTPNGVYLLLSDAALVKEDDTVLAWDLPMTAVLMTEHQFAKIEWSDQPFSPVW